MPYNGNTIELRRGFVPNDRSRAQSSRGAFMPAQPSRPAVPTRPMVPNNALVMAANAGLSDPNFRDSIRQMHAEGYPLVKMVEALGLDDELTDPIRQILENLDPTVVAGIRQATLEMLDSKNFMMPLDCTVTDAELGAGIPVEVEVLPESNKPTIHVRPATVAK
jgi:hypothetical protein